MAAFRYKIRDDDDGHWYLVPVQREDDFMDAEEPDTVPDVIPINGPVSLVTFENPRIDGKAPGNH